MDVESVKSIRLSPANSWKALLLSLILGLLAAFLLLSILDTTAIGSTSPEENVPDNVGTSTSTAASTTPVVSVTKTITPATFDMGDGVKICFTVTRPSLDVVLVQDVSGSMTEEDVSVEGSTNISRLMACKVAAGTFISTLQSTDRVAIVPYSNTAYLAQPLTTTEHKHEISETIFSLIAEEEWQTNIGEGISVAHHELISSSHYAPDTTKAIILLSDGKANLPGTGDAPTLYALQQAQEAANHGIKVYTIGFGEEFSETLLMSIAEIGNGEFYSVPDTSDLVSVYLTIAVKLHTLVITDILPPGVTASCPESPAGCTGSGTNTITWFIDNSSLISNPPPPFCFTATVNLTPGYEGPINEVGSGFCYEIPGEQPTCPITFTNSRPRVTVGGRIIRGYVFYDLNLNGRRDIIAGRQYVNNESQATNVAERGASGVIVRTVGWTATTTTDASGNYTLGIPSEPAVSVTLDLRGSSYAMTQPFSKHIPPITPTLTQTYEVSFGIHIPVYLPLVMKNYAPPSLRRSEKEVDKAEACVGQILHYTITLSNSGTTESIFASVTDPIITGSTFITGTLSGGGEYDRDKKMISYSGTLGPLQSHAIEFEVQVADTACTGMIANKATITSKKTITADVSEQLTLPAETIILPCLSNGDFEDGWTGWTRGGDTYLSSQYCPSPGNYCARLGDPAYKCWGGVPRGLRGWIEQSFCVPPTGSPKLYFWYRIFTNDTNENLDDEHDRFDVKINGVQKFRDMRQDGLPHCNDAEDLEEMTGMIDLSGYKGSYITIQFEVWNEPDEFFNTWVYIDNVRIAQ